MPAIKLDFSSEELIALRREIHIIIGAVEGLQLLLKEVPQSNKTLITSLNKVANIFEIPPVRERVS